MILRCFSIVLTLTISAMFVPSQVAQQAEDTALKTQLLAMAPSAVLKLASRISPRDHQVPIDVMFTDADLEGSGKFNFVVALFFTTEGVQDGFLRVFKRTPNGLIVAGDQEDPHSVGAGLTTFTLVDVKGDGVPAVEIDGTGYSGKTTSFALYSWTGSSLHLMTRDADTVSAFLADIDGDGQLELISPSFEDPENLPPGTEPKVTAYAIYKLQGNDYQFLRDSSTDPSGRLDTDGQPAVLRLQARIEPSRFPLEEIRRVLAGKGPDRDGDRDEAVRVTLRNLRAPGNKRVPIDQLDPATLVFDRTLKPLRVSFRPADRDEDGEREDKDDDAQSLRAEFSRTAVFKLLKRLQFSKPLEPGDKITIIMRSKLKDGRSARGGVSVTLVGEPDRDEHRDKD